MIERYREGNMNLRTQLQRIIRKTGLSSWPKLFHNLRATRATELASEHPAHVAAAWLGHSTIVANKHYWQVTDADFEKATTGNAEGKEKAAQKAAQPECAMARDGSVIEGAESKKALILPSVASYHDTRLLGGMGATGLEPVTFAL